MPPLPPPKPALDPHARAFERHPRTFPARPCDYPWGLHPFLTRPRSEYPGLVPYLSHNERRKAR